MTQGTDNFQNNKELQSKKSKFTEKEQFFD